MSPSSLHIRNALNSDIPFIQAIYAHHVRHGTATFEEEIPSVEVMLQRYQHIIATGYPFLVVELDDKLVGYAYLSTYRPRPAYRYTVENSIYLHPAYAGQGIGTALLQQLITQAEQGPWRLMIAVIGDSENKASIHLHQKLGFIPNGIEPGSGFKFGRWVDTVLMYRPIGPGNTRLPEI